MELGSLAPASTAQRPRKERTQGRCRLRTDRSLGCGLEVGAVVLACHAAAVSHQSVQHLCGPTFAQGSAMSDFGKVAALPLLGVPGVCSLSSAPLHTHWCSYLGLKSVAIVPVEVSLRAFVGAAATTPIGHRCERVCCCTCVPGSLFVEAHACRGRFLSASDLGRSTQMPCSPVGASCGFLGDQHAGHAFRSPWLLCRAASSTACVWD